MMTPAKQVERLINRSYNGGPDEISLIEAQRILRIVEFDPRVTDRQFFNLTHQLQGAWAAADAR